MMIAEIPAIVRDWPMTVGLALTVIAGVVSVVKGMQWADERFVSRREFDRAVVDSARNEKLLEHIGELTNAIVHNRK